jgi:hypothetical protein
MARPAILDQLKDQTHTPPGGEQAAPSPEMMVLASSSAPTGFEDMYSSVTHQWNRRYVFPSEYRLRLYITHIQPTMKKPTQWRVESVDGLFPAIEVTDIGANLIGRGLPSGVVVKIPQTGPLRITATWGTKVFKMDNYRLRDFLVVSIGDSFSSGQGNPDQPGMPNASAEAVCEMTTLVQLVQVLKDKVVGIPVLGDAIEFVSDVSEIPSELVDRILGAVGAGDADPTPRMLKEPLWLEPIAWRSLLAAPAQVARSLANGGHGRLTTFVSVAQSGAEIESGLLKPQRKQISKFGQVEEIQRFLDVRDHRPAFRANSYQRPVDLLIMSIGGNDVGFSGTLSDMTTEGNVIGMLDGGRSGNRDDIVRTLNARLDGLPAKYDKLAAEIKTRLNPKAVLIPEYPIGMFDDKDGKPAASCGIFDIGGPLGINKEDAKAIKAIGERLNQIIADAAKRHGWTVATGIVDDFKGHGYCSGSSWYVFAEQSCRRQDDLEGTMHPNTAGTLASAKRMTTAGNLLLNQMDGDNTAGVRIPSRSTGARTRTTTVRDHRTG